MPFRALSILQMMFDCPRVDRAVDRILSAVFLVRIEFYPDPRERIQLSSRSVHIEFYLQQFLVLSELCSVDRAKALSGENMSAKGDN